MIKLSFKKRDYYLFGFCKNILTIKWSLKRMSGSTVLNWSNYWHLNINLPLLDTSFYAVASLSWCVLK